MTKISFTYYGISVKHLQDILKEAGIEEITVADIKKQNVSYRQGTECSSDYSLAQNESDLQILTRSDEGLGEQPTVDMVGHHRQMAKRFSCLYASYSLIFNYSTSLPVVTACNQDIILIK